MEEHSPTQAAVICVPTKFPQVAASLPLPMEVKSTWFSLPMAIPAFLSSQSWTLGASSTAPSTERELFSNSTASPTTRLRNTVPVVAMTTFPANYSSCILGQVYYDAACSK